MIIYNRHTDEEIIAERARLIRADLSRCDTTTLREELFNLQSGRCVFCTGLHLDGWSHVDWELQGWDSVTSELDHLVSVDELAGRTDLTDEQVVALANADSNLVLMHSSCNTVKKHHDIEEFREDIVRGVRTLGRPKVWTAEEIEQERQRRAEVNKRLSQNPKWRAANAEAGKKRSQDPNWQAATAEANKKLSQDPNWQAANKAAGERRSKDPNWRTAQAAGVKKKFQDPEWRAANAEANKKKAQDPNWQAAQAEGVKKRSQDPKWRAAQVELGKKRSQDPKWRAGHAAMLHNRWHVERGIVKPSCLLCTAERSDLIA